MVIRITPVLFVEMEKDPHDQSLKAEPDPLSKPRMMGLLGRPDSAMEEPENCRIRRSKMKEDPVLAPPDEPRGFFVHMTKKKKKQKNYFCILLPLLPPSKMGTARPGSSEEVEKGSCHGMHAKEDESHHAKILLLLLPCLIYQISPLPPQSTKT